MNEPTLQSLRKRMLMFYFAAGLNVMMGLFVLTAGGGTTSTGMLWLIALVFLAFAGINYYLARVIRKRWEDLTRQQR